MAQGSRDGIRKPVCDTVLRARGSDLDLVSELPYGPAAYDGRIRGRTDVSTQPTRRSLSKILLALTGASTDVANFRGGRAIPNDEMSLSRKRIELLRWAHFARRQQLALPDHVHQFDAGKRRGSRAERLEA